jgi:hypothetical protein
MESKSKIIKISKIASKILFHWVAGYEIKIILEQVFYTSNIY